MKDFKLSFVDNTTFAGKDLEGFYSEALLKGTSKEAFKLIPNVKSKAKLGLLNLGTILQDSDCDFAGAGEGTLAQKEVVAHDVKINLEYCAKTFETNYLSDLMRAGSNSDQVMPDSVEAYLMQEVAKKVSNDLEYIAWQGSGATVATLFQSEPGLEYKLANDADVIDVTGVTLDKSNIIAEISKAYDATPATILQKEDIAIFMNQKAASFYRQALAAASSEAYYMQKHDELEFLGIKIIVANGLSDNKMVVASQSNLLLITDLMSDFGEILVLPQRGINGRPVVRMVGEFKVGFDFVYGGEIVFYSI